MTEDNWLEISVVVDGELAEAVAEVLSRYVPNGVVIESTAIQPSLEDEGTPVGPLRVSGYLPMDEATEAKRRQIEEALWYLGRIQTLPTPQFRLVHEADWAEAWKAHYHPIAIGRQLMIVPAWLESPDETRIPIRMDPGMAFGTGTHPTTQLCLELIELILSGEVGERGAVRAEETEVIDIGCGSGILSIAALKLGARRALAVDIDPQAARITRENAAENGVAEGMQAGVGSLDEIRAGAFDFQQADLVLANILAPVIVRLLDEGLAQLLKSDGLLVLSGIIDTQEPEVEAAYRRAGLEMVARRQISDWVALCVG